MDCKIACYTKHLEPNNINYPLKFYESINEMITTWSVCWQLIIIRCENPSFLIRKSLIPLLAAVALPTAVNADTCFSNEDNLNNKDKKTEWQIQGQTQGAGIPNSTGIGPFIPFAIKEKSL